MIQFTRRYTGDRGAPLAGLPEWMSGMLRGRGVDTEEKAGRFLNPSEEDLHDPHAMAGMDRAIQLIREAIEKEERILIYGDYDCDGVCATAILLEALREEGARVDFRLPRRHTEGYGLNMEAIREIARDHQLLITVDCGISNAAEVREARRLGMKVIVTDHHELPETLPEAEAVLDPLMGDYPFRRLCGAGVALKICQALQGMDSVRKRMEIAALATVADIVPLVDENRYIVREGMLRMARTSRPGLRALMDLAGVKAPIRSDDLGFRLGPRINAAGRLEDATQAVILLTTTDDEEGRRLAAHLQENNTLRQTTERRMMEEALDLFPEQVNLTRDRVIILEGENWNNGLIGLVAGKLCEKYHHPTIVLSRQGEQAVGSCRSIPGVHIWKMLNQCDDLLLRFGGHEQAAGLTIPVENLPEFRIKLNRVMKENCDPACWIPVREYDAELTLGEVTLEAIDRLAQLEPTGYGNPPPVFLTRDCHVQEARRVGKDRSHLKMTLLADGDVRDGIGFGLGEEADKGLQRVDVLYCPERNEFNGRVMPQMRLMAVRPAQSGEGNEWLVLLLQEMSLLASKRTEYPAEDGSLRPEHLLKETMDSINLSDEELREMYKALRGMTESQRSVSLGTLAEALGRTEAETLTALWAFRETKLIRWRMKPFWVEMVERPAKCAMTDSPVIRYIRSRKR